MPQEYIEIRDAGIGKGTSAFENRTQLIPG